MVKAYAQKSCRYYFAPWRITILTPGSAHGQESQSCWGERRKQTNLFQSTSGDADLAISMIFLHSPFLKACTTSFRLFQCLLKRQLCWEVSLPNCVSLSFLWVKVMTAQNKSSVTEERLSWLESKFALGRRVTPKVFKQIFHSQKPIQVNKCWSEHFSDPKFSQICYELRFLDWSILTYIRVFMLEPKQRRLLKKWGHHQKIASWKFHDDFCKQRSCIFLWMGSIGRRRDEPPRRTPGRRRRGVPVSLLWLETRAVC